MQTVLITSAKGAVGRLAAEALAERGYRVVAGVPDSRRRNAAAAEALRASARASGHKLFVVDLDVGSEASVRAAVDAAAGSVGPIDVAVNNAGFAALGLTEAYTDEQVRAIFEATLFGAQRVVRAVLPSMRARRTGLLLTVSTTMTHVAYPYAAFFTGAQRALAALAEAYRHELRPSSIDSVLLEIGPLFTPVFTDVLPPEDIDRVAAHGPLAARHEQLMSNLMAQLGAPTSPDPQAICDALVQLIEAREERPFRTIVDPVTGDAARALAAAGQDVQDQVMTAFGLGALLDRRRA